MAGIEDYLTSEEISFYEKGIPKFSGWTGISIPGLKETFKNNPIQFFKSAARYISRNQGNIYSFEKTIDDSNLSRGGKRKLKRVLLDKQEENIAEPIMRLAKDQEFQKLYSRVFIPLK